MARSAAKAARPKQNRPIALDGAARFADVDCRSTNYCGLAAGAAAPAGAAGAMASVLFFAFLAMCFFGFFFFIVSLAGAMLSVAAGAAPAAGAVVLGLGEGGEWRKRDSCADPDRGECLQHLTVSIRVIPALGCGGARTRRSLT